MESVLKFIRNSEVSSEILDATIEKIKDLEPLRALLDVKLHSMNYSTHHKVNLDLTFIYTNDTEDTGLICEVLQKALHVCKDVEETLLGIATYIKEKYRDLNYNLKITQLLNVLITFSYEENKFDILKSYLTPEFIYSFLLQALLQIETKIYAYQTLRYYFSILDHGDQIQCFNAVFEFSYQNKDFDVFCAILNHVSEDIFKNAYSCFTSDKFWIYLESCISGTETYLQNRGEFVLLKCIKLMKNRSMNYYVNVCDGDINITWEAFFMLLDVGREKQLHLVEPALDMLKYMPNLCPLWQKCIYRIYLRHSQNSVVYRVAIHLLNQTFEGNNLRDILKLYLPAVNKNEHSELSCEVFRTFQTFCLNIDNKDFNILLEEILLIPWNPVSFWKIIQNVFVLENKMQIYIDYFVEILRCAANLPHVYIRSECIKYLLKFFWDKKSFFKIYKILCALQKNGIDYYRYCEDCQCEYSEEIDDFVLNELLNLKESSDPEKSKICVMILTHTVFDESYPLFNRCCDKVSPHVKLVIWDTYFYQFIKISKPIILYKQVEQFLIEYYNDYLHQDTTESYLNLLLCLMVADQFYPENAIKNVVDAVFNPENYNKNQLYVSFAVMKNLQSFKYVIDEKFDIDIGQRAITNWRSKIDQERDPRVCKEFIGLVFAENFDKFSIENTILIINIFSSMFECQNNDVLEYIYEKIYTLLNLSDAPMLVIDFIDICHGNLKVIKKDQYFKGIVDKFIKIVFTPTYFFLNWRNVLNIKNSLLELSECHPIIRLNWVRAIYKLLNDENLDVFVDFLCILSVDIYLQGLIVTKDARTEFNICQEFLQNVSSSDKQFSPWHLCEPSNPNFLNAASRILALEVLLKIGQRHIDLVTNCLREKYLTFFKKRYFPGSEIHFQKLRIVQAMMLLIPYIQQNLKTARQVVVFAYDCFLEEANQNCIKQLFDWILMLLLLKVKGCSVIEYVRRITTSPTPASATVKVGLVPAVYHLTVLGDEEAFNETIRLVLPWTMGPQFKLRVYAQDLIRRLFTHARLNNYNDFLKKYKHLEDSIESSIYSTDAIFENTMKADLLFIKDFDLFGDNSLKTIFCDIPRLNGVCATEWQNMLFYISRPNYLEENKIICECTPLESQNTKFSDAIDEFLNKENNTHVKEESVIRQMAGLNIQKKINPWKAAMEDVDCKLRSNFILIASLIDKPQNLGGLSRTCEVFGIKSIVLNDVNVLKDKEFRSLSMSSETSINAVEVKVKDLETYIVKCRAEGYCVVGAEQTACSVKLNEFKFPQKTALILGNEKTGIPPKFIPLLDACLEIPQFGQVRSLNVHVAGATFIWEYAKQHLV